MQLALGLRELRFKIKNTDALDLHHIKDKEKITQVDTIIPAKIAAGLRYQCVRLLAKALYLH